MRRVIAAAAAWVIGAVVLAPAQESAKTAPPTIAAAVAALGADGVHTIRYSGFGSTYSVGQSPAPGSPWPRVTLKKYEALVDYDAVAMQEDYLREAGAIQPRGGGLPFTGEQRQLQMLRGTIAWNVPYGRPPRGRGPGPSETPALPPTTPPAPSPPFGGRGAPPVPLAPQGAAASVTDRIQQVWSTPHGFLKAAVANSATTVRGSDGVEVSFSAGGRRFRGVLNTRNEVERVRTWLDDPVLGDMLVESTFSGYEKFGVASFPTHIVERRGGFPVLDLFVGSVELNAKVDVTVPDSVRDQALAPTRVQVEKIGNGVYYLTGGSHHSVAIEMADHVVLVEAPLNEERSIALLAAVTETLPAKPIRFVINTHHHFDHAGGLRTFVDAGATIVTHEMNKRFYETAWSAPRSINPDRLARSMKAPAFITFTDAYTLKDASRTLELHRLTGNPHNDGFVVVYLPGEKLLIEADAFTPADGAPAPPAAPPGPPGFPAPVSPTTLNLYQNIQRLKLDVAQIAALHGPRLAQMSELASAVGVN